jgi:hypothetical protein
MTVTAQRLSRPRRPAPSRPVERPTSIVRTTRPDVFTHDSIRKPRVHLPAVDAKRLVKRGRRMAARFTANLEIPLVDAAYLQKAYGHSLAGLETFVSLAVQNGASGQQPQYELREHELWVVVTVQVSLPLDTVRRLNDLTSDPELLAGTLSRFIRLEIEARKANAGAWERHQVMGGETTREGFALFRGDRP